MNRLKDHLLDILLITVFLLLFLSIDDSYENAELSAQVLDEAIAQANHEKKTVNHELAFISNR